MFLCRGIHCLPRPRPSPPDPTVTVSLSVNVVQWPIYVIVSTELDGISINFLRLAIYLKETRLCINLVRIAFCLLFFTVEVVVVPHTHTPPFLLFPICQHRAEVKNA